MPTTSEADPFLPFLKALARLGSAEFSGQQDANQQALALHADFLRIRETVSRIRMASELKLHLRGCSSIADTVPILEMEMGRLFNGASGGLYLLAPSGDRMNVVAEWPAEGATGKGFLPADCWGHRLGRPYSTGPGLEVLRCRHADRSLDGPTLCIPLGGPNRRSGVLHRAFDPETGAVLAESDLGQFAAQIGDDLALGLSLLHLGEELRRRAVSDPLTGLFSESYFEPTLHREVARADRCERPVSVVLFHLDLDGHGFPPGASTPGQSTLFQLGVFFRLRFRAEDVACRLSDQDYAVILPDCSAENAGKRIAPTIEALATFLPSQGSAAPHPMTVCAGIASYPDHASDAESLLRQLRAAGQAAKAKGVRRVEFPPETQTR